MKNKNDLLVQSAMEKLMKSVQTTLNGKEFEIMKGDLKGGEWNCEGGYIEIFKKINDSDAKSIKYFVEPIRVVKDGKLVISSFEVRKNETSNIDQKI